MIKKEGKFPVNARVDVDYSEGKPKVKFSYPMKNPKKEASSQARSPFLFIFIWILIGLIPYIFINIGVDSEGYPKDCGNFSLDKLDYNWIKIYEGDLNFTLNDSYKAIYGFNLTCDNELMEFKYNQGYFSKKQKYNLEFILDEYGDTLWLYFSVPITSLLVILLTRILVKRKWYQKWFPKAQAEGVIFKTKKKKYIKFYAKDIINNIAFVPSFSNVELDYKTMGDFSNKLLSIKIREYRTQNINIKTKKKSKVKVNNYKWYAIFYFKEKPKDGYLEVIYQ